jgi:hypothetical protein
VTPNGSSIKEEKPILHNNSPNNNNHHTIELNEEKDDQKMEVVEETISENTDPQVSKEAVTAKELPPEVEMEEDDEEADEEQIQENGKPRTDDLSCMKSPEGNNTILPRKFLFAYSCIFFHPLGTQQNKNMVDANPLPHLPPPNSQQTQTSSTSSRFDLSAKKLSLTMMKFFSPVDGGLN